MSWSSKKQPTVALLSTEAEYRGAAMAACEVAWMQKLLAHMGEPMDRAVVIFCDIMRVAFSWPVTQCFMLGPNTLRFIIIL